MIRHLADQRGAASVQFRLYSKIEGTLPGTIQRLPADLPTGSQSGGRRHQEAVIHQLNRDAELPLGTLYQSRLKNRARLLHNGIRRPARGHRTAYPCQLVTKIRNSLTFRTSRGEMFPHPNTYRLRCHAARKIHPLNNPKVLHKQYLTTSGFDVCQGWGQHLLFSILKRVLPEWNGYRPEAIFFVNDTVQNSVLQYFPRSSVRDETRPIREIVPISMSPGPVAKR